MPPIVATIIYVIGILGLFYLDRDENARTSLALWIPAAWLFIISSRNVSLWLGMAPTTDSPEALAEGSPIDRAVFMGLLFAGLAVVVTRMDRVGPLLRSNAPTVLFFLFCALSILWSDFPLVAFKRWIKAIGDVVMVLIILTEPDPMGALKRLVSRLGFLLFPLSILFIKYYPNLGTVLTQSWFLEATGVTVQKNQLGMTCLVYGLGFLWIIRTSYHHREDPSRTRRLVAYGAILAMVVWLLQISDALTSLSALAMAGGIMLLVGRPSRPARPAVVHLLVAAVLAIALFAIFFESGGVLLKSVGRDTTLTGRTNIWGLVLDVHISRWVGTGFESFWLGDRLASLRGALPNFPINEAHNGYLEVYLNLGWIGVSFLALLLLNGYRKVIAKFRQDPDSGSLFLAYVLAAVIFSLTEAGFRMMTGSWIFFLLATLAASQSASPEYLAQTDVDQCNDLVDSGPQPYAIYGAPLHARRDNTW